jgi:hypothetical protein
MKLKMIFRSDVCKRKSAGLSSRSEVRGILRSVRGDQRRIELSRGDRLQVTETVEQGNFVRFKEVGRGIRSVVENVEDRGDGGSGARWY